MQKQPKEGASLQNEKIERILRLLLTTCDPLNGKAYVHRMKDSLWLSNILLTRLRETPGALSKEVLLAKDAESQYTPLHWAVWKRDLPTILLLIRNAMENSPPRLTQRPMAVLMNDTVEIAAAKDAEGMTAGQLLLMEQRDELRHCRLNLRNHTTVKVTRSRRSSSFANEQDELDELSRNLNALDTSDDAPESENDNDKKVDYGCEVLTFGRAHHCALGVASSGNAADSEGKVRPQRVVQFAQDYVGRKGGAVAISCSTHHTLVVSRQGFLYACGLGKGGRLGTGTESHCPIPTRILGALVHHHVVGVAAAENHSLCVTRSGEVFAWGSNGFGQLGKEDAGNTRLAPRRVDDLKNTRCRAVAAGTKHSVAVSAQGEIYVWGSNSEGQLGVTRRNGTHPVQRIESLWTASKRGVAVAASERTTLILTQAGDNELFGNGVYSCGHGSSGPTKIHFEPSKRNRNRPVNPVAISCARYHSAAISADGLVYTWGLHADSLGVTTSQITGVSAPQLVAGMLPENGGGFAVGVSASENHTAVITDKGELYTWGASNGKDILGHDGLRCQRTPKRVPGIHRAVSLAAAKEHFVLLMGAAFPVVPKAPRNSTLGELAAYEIARHVDLFNLVPCLTMAERMNSSFLKTHCRAFLEKNLDGVLGVGQKSVMNNFVDEMVRTSFAARLTNEGDEHYYPLLSKLAFAGCHEALADCTHLPFVEDWLKDCTKICDDHDAEVKSLGSRVPGKQHKGGVFKRSRGLSLASVGEVEHQVVPLECSYRCKKATINMDLSSEGLVDSKFDLLTKEIRGIRKRINQIKRLQTNDGELTPDQREKVHRLPQLECDLESYEVALFKVETRKEHYIRTSDKHCNADDENVEEESTQRKGIHYCEVCGISCPDLQNLEIHKSGRKHRNKVSQANEEAKKQAARLVQDEKRLKEFSKVARPANVACEPEKVSPWQKKVGGKNSSLPSFCLPPPPHPIGEFHASSPTGAKTGLRSLRSEFPSPDVDKAFGWKAISGGAKSKAKKDPSNADLIEAAKKTPQSSSMMEDSPKKALHSLGDFLLEPAASPKPIIPKTSQWASPQKIVKTGPAVSLADIQDQEAKFTARKDKTFKDNGKWFIERRERAISLSEIQGKEQEDVDFQLLVEEQKEIEAQIMRDVQASKPKPKKKKTRGDPTKTAKKLPNKTTPRNSGKRKKNKCIGLSSPPNN